MGRGSALNKRLFASFLLYHKTGHTVSSILAPLYRYSFDGATHVPLKYKQFIEKMHRGLAAILIQPSEYSRHSFRRGGTTYALQCGSPADLVKLQGD